MKPITRWTNCPMLLVDLDAAQSRWLAGLAPDERREYDAADTWSKVAMLAPHRRARKKKATNGRVH